MDPILRVWRSMAVAALVPFLALGPTGGARGDELAQEFRSGRSAYNLGDYSRAFTLWLPLADRGHAKSQAALGYLYLMGLGVAQDDAEAARWYGRAASQDEVNGQYYLGMLYLRGRGVRRADVRAYMLCDLALAKGEAKGLHCRDSAAENMTTEQLDRANRLVAEWYSIPRYTARMN